MTYIEWLRDFKGSDSHGKGAVPRELQHLGLGLGEHSFCVAHEAKRSSQQVVSWSTQCIQLSYLSHRHHCVIAMTLIYSKNTFK